MQDKNQDYMGWNAPGDGGSGGPSNQGGDSGNRGDNNNNNNNDPWGRRPQNDLNLEAFFNNLKRKFQGRGSSSRGGGSGGKKPGLTTALGLGVLALLAVYVFLGFYQVREAERGVVLRFGKMYEVVDPGLRWKFTGIDTVNVIDIEQVRALRSSGTMLTQDENMVLVEMDVQYRISDPFKYLYSLTNPDQTLLEATDSALRYVVGHTLMDDILTSGREMVRQNTRELLTSIIEPYNTGLSIVEVNFLPARAPDEVKAAFDDAIAAQEDEQRYKREAEAYANEVLPKAEGRVQRINQEAEAYRSQVVLKAQGEVARFEKVLPEYNAAPDITRTRMYLETMQEVLANSQKILLDTPEGSSPVLYLPLPQQPLQAPVQAAPKADSASQASTDTASYPPLSSSTQNNGKRGAR